MIIRPFTIVSGLLFVVSGAMMFVVKHQSQMLDSQISDVNESTTRDEQSIRVLQAQWALEADPSRLASLAAQFTGLQPMKPGQLVTMASLGTSLPAPGARPPGSNPEDPVPALPQLAAATPAAAPGTAAPVQTAAITAPATAAPAAPVPAMVAAAAPLSPAAVQTAPVQAAPVQAAPVQLAAASAPAPAYAHAVTHHHVTPEHFAEAVPVRHVIPPRPAGGSSVYMAAASAAVPPAHAMPMGAQLVPVRAVATPAPVPQDNGGSLLGMAQDENQ
jgi:hypothetical protein